jgi:5'-3' exonuclease
MGIPSYYRTLVVKLPHSIKRSIQGAGTLVIDMNCMVYHVLKEPSMAQHIYPGEEGRLAWEKILQKEVCTYLTHIWRSSGSPHKVFIALDGVVPYAKIKQQRFRRFKSAVARAPDAWDTNAITPGTAFMASLASELRQTGSKYGWILSDADEPGEGEHKVLRWLLTTTVSPGPIVIYGLDADLILLGLLAGERLGPAHPIFLLRESQAFGKLVRRSESDTAELGFFDLSELRNALSGEPWTRHQLYDYIFGMSFCGNDFLPTGLSLRIRDDGHSILLNALHDLWKVGKHLVTFADTSTIARPCPEGLLWISKWFLKQEERLIISTVRRKMSARHGEVPEDNIPLIEQAEKPLIRIVDNDRILLRANWQDIYNRLALGDSDKEHRKACVKDYWTGWCWILDYYQGLPVDLDWVYANGYPPTWSDLIAFFSIGRDLVQWTIRQPLEPQEQLALVLPLSSWGLLTKTKYRLLPTRLPQYWPQGFHLETFGKRFGWECEPMIPLFTPARLRYEVLGMNPV